MNPLTREVLLTLIDEASDEQVIMALSQPSTSVLLFRFILKQYMIDFTSTAGNKIDHQQTIYKWSKILGYVDIEEQRKRATVSTEPPPIIDLKEEDEIGVLPNIENKFNAPSIASSTSTLTQIYSPSFGSQLFIGLKPINNNNISSTDEDYDDYDDYQDDDDDDDNDSDDDDDDDSDDDMDDDDDEDIEPAPTAITSRGRMRANTYTSGTSYCRQQQSLPFGISPISAIRTSEKGTNLFRAQTDAIAEDTEEDEFAETKQNYDKIASPPITPPISTPIKNEQNNIKQKKKKKKEKEKEKEKKKKKSMRDKRHYYKTTTYGSLSSLGYQYYRRFSGHGRRSRMSLKSSSSSGTESETPEYNGNDINDRNHEKNNKTKLYTPRTVMFDEDEIDERFILNRQSINIDLSDDDNEIMVELSSDFGKFRASLFMKIWLNITSYLDQNDKLLSLQFVSKKFRAIALATNHWKCIDIKRGIFDDNNKLKKLLKFLHSVYKNILEVTIYCSSCSLLSLFIDKFINLEKLIIYGSINDIDCLHVLRNNMNSLRILCFDLNNENMIDYESRNEICKALPLQIEEFWIPHCVTTKWLIDCFKYEKLLKLKRLKSFPRTTREQQFESDILRLIADHCINIEYICIDCKLQNELEFAETFKYLLVKCKKLNYIQLKFDISYNLMTENQFLIKFAKLKINCLEILENQKYHCSSSSTNKYDIEFKGLNE